MDKTSLIERLARYKADPESVYNNKSSADQLNSGVSIESKNKKF